MIKKIQILQNSKSKTRKTMTRLMNTIESKIGILPVTNEDTSSIRIKKVRQPYTEQMRFLQFIMRMEYLLPMWEGLPSPDIKIRNPEKPNCRGEPTCSPNCRGVLQYPVENGVA
jgi:predicted ATP-dependent Lon-type protease